MRERPTLDGDAILRLRDLDAGYGDLQILSDVDLDVADGEYVTIVGPNGAGKSTVMKTVFGLTTYMDGTVEFEGEPIHGLAPEQIIPRGDRVRPADRQRVPGSERARESRNGRVHSRQRPRRPDRRDLRPLPDPPRAVGTEGRDALSAAAADGRDGAGAHARSDLLLLDEPSAGLAPDLVADMFDRIDRINDSGTAGTHGRAERQGSSGAVTRGYVLVNGENRYTDRGEVLLGDEDVRKDFLGG